VVLGAFGNPPRTPVVSGARAGFILTEAAEIRGPLFIRAWSSNTYMVPVRALRLPGRPRTMVMTPSLQVVNTVPGMALLPPPQKRCFSIQGMIRAKASSSFSMDVE